MDMNSFPKLPRGFRWSVKFSREGNWPRVTVTIKGVFRTYASDWREPGVTEGEFNLAATKAAKDAYRKFVTSYHSDVLETLAMEYQININNGLARA